MESLKKIIVNPYRGQAKFEDNDKYGERKRRFQAECLVPEKISRDCITSIHVYNDPELISTATRLIDNSGLRIRLETLDKYQKGIKRHKPREKTC